MMSHLIAWRSAFLVQAGHGHHLMMLFAIILAFEKYCVLLFACLFYFEALWFVSFICGSLT